MLLLDLPTELLVIIYETLPDVRTLHNLTRTSSFARDLYVRHSVPILDQVLSNSYPDVNHIIKGTVTARRCKGALRYKLDEHHHIKEWIVPPRCWTWKPNGPSAENATEVLQMAADLVNEIENLAEHCKKCRLEFYGPDSPEDECQDGVSSRELIVMTLIQLQSCANIMYNLRVNAWPAPQVVSLLRCALDSPSMKVTKRTESRAQAVIEAHLSGSFCTGCVHRMWLVMQTLAQDYPLLRHHRLQPHQGSLMGLLFGYESTEGGWCINLKDAILDVLRNRQVPAFRHGPRFQFVSDMTDELRHTDLEQFRDYIYQNVSVGGRGGLPVYRDAFGASPAEFCATTNVGICSRQYLERFRPLVGLPFGNSTPVWHLVRPRTRVGPTIAANCYWAYESTVWRENSPLGLFLKVCESENLEREEAKRRPKRVARDADGDVSYNTILGRWFLL